MMQIQYVTSNGEVAQLLANYTLVAFATASSIESANSRNNYRQELNCRLVMMLIGQR